MIVRTIFYLFVSMTMLFQIVSFKQNGFDDYFFNSMNFRVILHTLSWRVTEHLQHLVSMLYVPILVVSFHGTLLRTSSFALAMDLSTTTKEELLEDLLLW